MSMQFSGEFSGAMVTPFGVPYCQSKFTVGSTLGAVAGCLKDWMLKKQLPLLTICYTVWELVFELAMHTNYIKFQEQFKPVEFG